MKDTYKAVEVSAPGVLRVVERPISEPGAGQVRIRVESVLSAFQDVETALVNYANEQVRNRSLTDALTASRRAVTMANELYLRGLNDFLNVLDTQRTLYTTESELTQSQATMASNLVALYKALGRGWESP